MTLNTMKNISTDNLQVIFNFQSLWKSQTGQIAFVKLSDFMIKYLITIPLIVLARISGVYYYRKQKEKRISRMDKEGMKAYITKAKKLGLDNK